MSELRATPGPWFACPSRVRLNGHTGLAKHLDGRWVINPVNDFERAPLAEVDCGDDECPKTRKHAEYDARLIAAAPELYAALEKVVSNIERIEYGHYSLDGHEDLNPDEWFKSALAVLARARGEQS